MTELDTLSQTFDFKGTTIQPLSYARRALILGMVNLASPGFMDVATAIYGAICDEKELIRARRKPEAFDESVARWIDKVKFGPADSEEAGRLLAALLDNSEENKAKAIDTDADLLPDPNS